MTRSRFIRELETCNLSFLMALRRRWRAYLDIRYGGPSACAFNLTRAEKRINDIIERRLAERGEQNGTSSSNLWTFHPRGVHNQMVAKSRRTQSL